MCFTPRLLCALSLLLALLAALLVAVPATAEAPPPGTQWSETYIDTADGESLHVDVIHPEGYEQSATAPRDVILVVSPYLGVTESPGPVNRFFDFYQGAYNGEGVFANGWSVVQVSLRGTGGSSGCLDILGPGEQLDVVTAVEWVDDQPWADGIALYGKSYDANTGAVAAAARPAGLDAIIAQAIAPDRYRGSYNDRVRLAQSLLYPSATYGVAAEGGFSSTSDSTYIANSASRSADCQALLAEHYGEDEQAAFWRQRDFVARAEGSTIPTFITAGYLDNATNIGAGAVDLFNALDGPKRLWVGWWDHVRGNDLADERLATGLPGFFDEVEAFLEVHVRGVDVADVPGYPSDPVTAQSSDGRFRSGETFPPAGMTSLDIPLRSGAYVDDGAGRGSADAGSGAGGLVTRGTAGAGGVWTVEEPVEAAVRVAGIPSATLSLQPTLLRSNVVVNVYDVAPDGQATMMTRGAAMVDRGGEVEVALFPTDWILQVGHRIGVLVHDANTEAYVHVPSMGQVVVTSGRVTLPVTDVALADAVGGSNPRLERYLTAAPFDATPYLPAAPGTATGLTSGL